MGTGAAEEAVTVFGDAASLYIQKQHLPQVSASKSMPTSTEDHGLISSRNFGSEDLSPRHLKHMHGNNQRDISGNYHAVPQSGGTGSQLSNGGSTTVSFYNTPSPMASATQVWLSACDL